MLNLQMHFCAWLLTLCGIWCGILFIIYSVFSSIFEYLSALIANQRLTFILHFVVYLLELRFSLLSDVVADIHN